VILEAFADYLRSADPDLPATWILSRWLWERLTTPAETVVDRVLHCEIGIEKTKAKRSYRMETGISEAPSYTFSTSSESGERLLRSLYQYCLSYDHQKWARWVHKLKASDFNDYVDGR
jgi:hypothetical protein